MAKTPEFVPARAPAPARLHDLLDDVEDTDRSINRMMAIKARSLVKAHTEYRQKFGPQNQGGSGEGEPVNPSVKFDELALVDRSFRAEVAAALKISERAATSLIGISEALV